MRQLSVLVLSIWFSLPLFANTQDTARPEMRAVWVATIGNIDWPDGPSTDPEKHKAAFIRLAETHKKNGINTLIVQIRPCSDAFYPSSLEPWSHWLTGKQGVAPADGFDPLAFMITETHKRGMEFHAWMNPYRAMHNLNSAALAPNHIIRQHPEWFVTYGDKRYFDPGNKNAQSFLLKVVEDVLTRYPIDALHFDDYFYPYPISGKPFPDQQSYAEHGNGLALNDWRRSNVDSIIYNIHTTIKRTRPNCQFGISPFGVWRNADKDPRGSKTKAGPTNYDYLYADILLWLKNDWIDYVAPQLYWEIGHKLADYNILVDWWSQNTYGKKCYIGLAPYRAGSNNAWRDKTQLPRQIEKLRATDNIHGMIFFSSRSLEQNLNGWADLLRENIFAQPAPTPKIR